MPSNEHESLTTGSEMDMLAQGLQDEYSNNLCGAGESGVEAAEALPATKAERMRKLRDNFTPAKLIQLFIDQPHWSFAEYASACGHTVSWFCSYLASDAFQLRLDNYRHLIENPQITGTLDERFKAITLQSLAKLQDKLNSDEVNDLTVISAVNVGVKALGLGAKRKEEAEEAPKPKTLQDMASYLENLGQQKASGGDVKLGVIPSRGAVQVVEDASFTVLERPDDC